jgi:glutathione synthase/RimK-type ligase-like ATP-grasp enzyme
MKLRETVFMNKICVIAKNKQTYFIKRLIEEVGQYVVLFDPWSDIEFPTAETYLCRTTGVYKSDLDLMMMKSLSNLVNPFEALKRFRSKSSQFYFMEEHDLPVLPWISLKEVDELTAEKFTVLYPEVVVKPDVGQGGWGLEVLRRDTLKSWMKKHDRDYLMQPFIKGAVELRYFFIKGEEPVVLKRLSKTGIAANFKKAGAAEVSELPPEFAADIEKLISKSGAHYGAIDLLIDQDRLFILELNVAPGIEQLEAVSGKNMIKVLLSSLNISN